MLREPTAIVEASENVIVPPVIWLSKGHEYLADCSQRRHSLVSVGSIEENNRVDDHWLRPGKLKPSARALSVCCPFGSIVEWITGSNAINGFLGPLLVARRRCSGNSQSCNVAANQSRRRRNGSIDDVTSKAKYDMHQHETLRANCAVLTCHFGRHASNRIGHGSLDGLRCRRFAPTDSPVFTGRDELREKEREI